MAQYNNHFWHPRRNKSLARQKSSCFHLISWLPLLLSRSRPHVTLFLRGGTPSAAASSSNCRGSTSPTSADRSPRSSTELVSFPSAYRLCPFFCCVLPPPSAKELATGRRRRYRPFCSTLRRSFSADRPSPSLASSLEARWAQQNTLDPILSELLKNTKNIMFFTGFLCWC